MLKYIFIFLCLVFCQTLEAQNEFTTIWRPSNVSTPNIYGGIPSTSTQIWFPGRGNNFNVSWEEVGYPTQWYSV